MRWQPTEPLCSECGFDWSTGGEECLAVVARAPADAAAGIDALGDPTLERGSRWSASMYVWHLVDVLRIGAERLLTLRIDPASGVPCWDENLLAEARRYRQLSTMVGLAALDAAARDWLHAAEQTPDAEVEHPQFGTLTTLDVIRRNAHEVHHHLRDVRSSEPPPT